MPFASPSRRNSGSPTLLTTVGTGTLTSYTIAPVGDSGTLMPDEVASIAGDRERPLTGLGGWLILVVIGLIMTPLLNIVSLVRDTNLDSLARVPAGLQAFVWFENAMTLVFGVLIPIYLVAIMFRLRIAFPQRFIWWLGTFAVISTLDLVALYVLFNDFLAARGVNVLSAEYLRDPTRTAISAAIWIPYMKMSSRVQNTFVT